MQEAGRCLNWGQWNLASQETAVTYQDASTGSPDEIATKWAYINDDPIYVPELGCRVLDGHIRANDDLGQGSRMCVVAAFHLLLVISGAGVHYFCHTLLLWGERSAMSRNDILYWVTK